MPQNAKEPPKLAALFVSVTIDPDAPFFKQEKVFVVGVHSNHLADTGVSDCFSKFCVTERPEQPKNAVTATFSFPYASF